MFEPALLNEIEEKSMTYTATIGQGLIKMNQPITVVPLMLSGILKVSRENEDGQDLVLYYVKAGESCAMTLSCGIMSQPSQVKGTAEEDLSMLCVPVPIMEEWMQKYPSWKKFVMGTIVNEYIGIIKSVEDITFKKMDERLVNFLKTKSKLSNSSLVNLSHQQIADELGTNRVVISRLLKRMENEKRLLLFRNQIKLLKNL
ncbi:MAG: Crp/Fnr family transcriptional regulator [Bacteroidetes bacterium]|nr:Crp/Fnr family transcriptional regulator [Bacteroidota bacterium]MBS1975287.1 Crp/Fnr family transcriptional regulator [Bacteroidota bacterium]